MAANGQDVDAMLAVLGTVVSMTELGAAHIGIAPIMSLNRWQEMDFALLSFSQVKLPGNSPTQTKVLAVAPPERNDQILESRHDA